MPANYSFLKSTDYQYVAEKIKVLFIHQENNTHTGNILIVRVLIFLHLDLHILKKKAYIFLLSLSVSLSIYILVMNTLDEEGDRQCYHNFSSSTWQTTMTH